MKKTISIVLILTLGMAAVCPAAEDTWTTKTSMSVKRAVLSTSAVNGIIYAIGGSVDSYTSTSAVEAYDAAIDSWTSKADLPQKLCGIVAGTVNDKIYVMGGSTSISGNGNVVNHVYEYNPVSNSWTSKSNIPTPLAYAAADVVNGKIYVIGGGPFALNSAYKSVYEYDPASDTWTKKSDMPTARFLASATAVDGKIYVFGGIANITGTAFSAVEVYDPTADTWAVKAPMPIRRSTHASSAVDGNIYIFSGGLKAGSIYNDVLEYNPTLDTWETKTSIPTPRVAPAACSLDGKIYVFGGMNISNTRLTKVEEYDTGLGVPSPDFNGDGKVDIEDLIILIEYWGTDEPLCDIAPPPFGDDIIDVQDLEVLMSYWGQEIDDPTLMAHWKLDETEGATAHDSTSDIKADLYGDPIWQPTGGMVNGALLLDGIDDYIGTWEIPGLSEGDFSLYAWIKGGALGQVIISEFDGVNWLMADAITGYLSTDLGDKPLVSEVEITDGSWHRVGLSWDGTNRVLIVDDVTVASDRQRRNIERSEVELNIGCGPDSTAGTFFSGLIDDVRIYNRAVTP